ncbi:MAG: CADD family putative folate metabolism protein [Dehalococcoidia bacterium]|nr:CADD family putative folate metabolism protein [Dehalococcoidia bacterium]
MDATHDVLGEVRALVRARSLLEHPFYQAWQHGGLNLEDLRLYAAQYYHHVLAFPQYVSAAHAQCPDQHDRQALLENLIEEERGDENHPELWLRFGEGIGAARSDVETAPPLPETRALVDLYRDVTARRSFAEACAALYVYESQVPDVARTKIAGLEQFFGISDSRTLHFFAVHVEADEVHAQVGADMVRRHASTPATRAAVLRSATECADALWTFLDGVEHARRAA